MASNTFAHRTLPSLIVAATAACLFAGSARAESLWDKRTPASAFLFTDNVATDVGDSLTVLITDTSSYAKTGAHELTKKSTTAATSSLKRGGEDLLPVLDLSSDSSHDWQASSNNTGSMTFADSITTTVVDKLPNGNLVVAGRSERSVAGEDVITILTGIVRPVDISGDNAVVSSRVANFRLYYERKGDDERCTALGWLTKICCIVWPF